MKRYYAVCYKRVQDSTDYTMEAERYLSLANPVAFSSKQNAMRL